LKKGKKEEKEEKKKKQTHPDGISQRIDFPHPAESCLRIFSRSLSNLLQIVFFQFLAL